MADNVTIIEISGGAEVKLDSVDVDLVSGFKWSAQKNRGTQYAQSTVNHESGRRNIMMHRLIMSAPKGMQVDHINGDGLDNRRSNLRLVTNSQNSYNRGVAKNNVSGFKGVGFHKKSGKWQARIAVDRKRKHIGLYDTPEQAAEAYEAESKKLHGVYSWANRGESQ